jgi:hypothetical protein
VNSIVHSVSAGWILFFIQLEKWSVRHFRTAMLVADGRVVSGSVLLGLFGLVVGVVTYGRIRARRAWLTIDPEGQVTWRDGRDRGSFDLGRITAAERGPDQGAVDHRDIGTWWEPPAELRDPDGVAGVGFILTLRDAHGHRWRVDQVTDRWVPASPLLAVVLDHLERADVPLDASSRYNLQEAAGRLPPDGAVARTDGATGTRTPPRR